MPAAIRVLHILPSLDESYGGPLRLVLDLSARAQSLGLESELVGVGKINIQDNPLDPARIHSVPAGILKTYAHSAELRRWLRRNLSRFDGLVVHGAWAYSGWAAAVEARAAGVPYAYFPHGMLERWALAGQGWLKQAKKRLYWRLRESAVCAGACCTFFTTAREMQRTAVTIPEPKRILRPYGMLPRPPGVDAPANRRLSVPSGGRIALFLGRLHPKKNVDLLIRAWKQADVAEPWRLVIAGAGSDAYEQQLRRLVDDLGLHPSVYFTGFVSGVDKHYLLQHADWFLLPSSQENFGVAVLEAVEQGCALAISDQVYLADSFPQGAEILPVDVNEWTRFFRERMQDLQWRDHVRHRDRAYLMPGFSIDSVVEHWAGTFQELFPRRRSEA